MNTKLFKLLTAGAIALLSACGDNTIEPGDSNASPVQTTATLNVLVKDAITNAALKASVQLSTGALDSTNASGFVYFKGVPVGEHSALIEKTGYASVVVESKIEPKFIENIYIAEDATINANLYPQNSGLEGKVLFEDKNGSSKPPTNATVRFIANANLNLVDNVFEVPVSSTDGKFTFTNLPAIGNAYSLQVLDAAMDGQKYVAKPNLTTGVTLLNGTTVYLRSSIKYTSSDLVDLFELTSFNSVIKSTDTLRLVFSDSIDAAKFKPEMIGFGNVTTPVEKIVDGKTLKLVPTDKWPSTFTFTIGGGSPTATNNLVSVKGMTYYTTAKTVYVDGIFELVSYKTTVKSKDTLVLEFSDAIDPVRFKTNMITLSSNGTLPLVDMKVDGKQVKLIPSGNWPNPSFTFTIGGGSPTATNNLVSVKGMTYYTTAKTVYLDGTFDIVSYTTLVETTDTVFVEFSDSIDAARFRPNYVTVRDDNWNSISCNKIVDGKTLKLVPTDKWPSNSFIFTIENTVLSVKGVANTNTSSKTVTTKGYFSYITHSPIPLATTDTLVIEFSDDIDTNGIYNNVTATGYTNNLNIKWVATDGKKLKLTPKSQSRWNAQSSASSFVVNFNSNFKSLSGILYEGGNKSINVKAYPFNIVSKLDSLDPNTADMTSPLIFEFNDTIDAAQLKPTSVYIEGYDIATKKSIVDYKKLKLELMTGDKWPNSDFNVVFYNNALKSINNVPFSSSTRAVKIIEPDLSGAQVTNLGIIKNQSPYNIPDTLNYNSSSMYLTWKRVAGVSNTQITNLTSQSSGYRIYRKEGTGNFTLLTTNYGISIPPSLPGDTTMRYAYVPFSNSSVLADGKSVEFIVQAVNSKSETSLNEANKLVVKDERKPTISSLGDYGYSWSQSSTEAVTKWFSYSIPSFTTVPSSCVEWDEGECISYSTEYTYETSPYGSNCYSSGCDKFRFGKLTNSGAYEYPSDYSRLIINFSEPMDTLSMDIKYVSDTEGQTTVPARFTVKKGWSTNRQSLYLTPDVAAGTSFNQDLSFRVQIQKLQDLNGNKIELKYTTPEKKTEDLEFRFEHVRNASLP